MKDFRYKVVLSIILFVACVPVLCQQKEALIINAQQIKADVNPAMWGVFFEDINFAADGGIYAELVKNRSFEFAYPLFGWNELKSGNASGKILINNRGEAKPNNPRYLNLSVDATDSSAFGLSNSGFRGMGVKSGNIYDFTVLARSVDGNLTIKVVLENEKKEKIGETSISGISGDWKKYQASFSATSNDAKAHLNVLFVGKGSVDIDMVSLFPRNTWKNRPGGLRADLVQWLADLKPGFVRFPGGCIVEGRDLENRYQWKNTIGTTEDRKLIVNRWNTEFKGERGAEDYYQSYGLGFYEYFLLCEDIGAEPLPILNCGMACQWNTRELVPIDQMDPYIQDMLDLIEFANGPADSKWGKIRAEMGHSAPFNLKMLGVGNEQWDEQYFERSKIITKVLKAKYPNIKLVASSGPDPGDDRFKKAWKEFTKEKADLVDEHYYMSPSWFLSNAQRYDQYDRKGPKVFAGEYAAHIWPKDAEGGNTWEAALSEAAFMTGLERNADVVSMASYAPLFGNINAWQWNPDCIWFDNLRSVGTANYYVQKMYSTNKGTHVVSILRNNEVVAGKDSIYANAVIDKNSNEVIVKIVNVSGVDKNFELVLNGATLSGKTIDLQILGTTDLKAFNTLDNPTKVSIQQKESTVTGSKISIPVGAKMFVLIRIPCKKL